jgi:hypothetical protein
MDSVAEKSVADLVMTAGKYCYFIENISEYNSEQTTEFLIKILPVLYIKGNLLPEIQSCEEDMIEHFVTEETWHKAFLSLTEKLGDADVFNIVYPEKDDNEVVKASVSEFLTDIYQDLKDFLLLFAKNTKTTQECALYECKRLYKNRWGLKIPLIMAELHKIIYTTDIKPQQENWN